MRKLIDISAPLQTGIASDPPGFGPHIDYYTHADTVEDLLAFFPDASKDDLPDGEGWAYEWVRATTHNGTHLDAPYHYSAVMDGGKRAATIDEVPLDWCLQPGVKLDFRHFPDGYVVHSGRRRERTDPYRARTVAARNCRREHFGRRALRA
ncbi:cyclase family protein [Rhodococcoides fascians]|uniref:cyclase family protein n=1 Tax=Rhodococcoides fascians TaxID=1828 RepID=UPI000AA7555B